MQTMPTSFSELPNPPTPMETPEKPKHLSKRMKIFLVVVLSFLALGAGTAFGFFLSKIFSTQTAVTFQTSESVEQQAEDYQEKMEQETNVLAINWIPVKSQSLIPTPQVILDQYFSLTTEDVPEGEIWYASGAFTQGQMEYFAEHELDLPNRSDEGDAIYSSDLPFLGYHTFWLGTVKNGTYEDYQLALSIVGLPGMGMNYLLNYLLIPPDIAHPVVFLDRYTTDIGSAFTSPRSNTNPSAAGLIIPELEEPIEPWVDANGNTFTYQGAWLRNDYPFPLNPDRFSIMTTINGYELREYLEKEQPIEYTKLTVTDNGFFYTREDGRTVWFDLEVPFWTNPYTPDSKTIPAPTISWSDGTQNDQLYIKGEIGGCGQVSYSNVIDSLDPSSLKQTGSYEVDFGKGLIYEPNDQGSEEYQSAYTNATLFNDSLNWDEFLALHPFFYWQDAFGRWIKFTNTSVLPAAECGKPVIYLYPEEPTDLTVSIDLKGGMSKSEPLYENGWSVTAYPDGTLTNHADQQTYPYLFWEGSGAFYTPPPTYWVVEQQNVESFLINTLEKLGLNQKETADFLEFWLPRMQDKAYYQIGFHGTSVMNQLAPLTFSTQPKTLVRILMDYQGLDSPIPENPPRLPPTPKRMGFTVIEWGGVLR